MVPVGLAHVGCTVALAVGVGDALTVMVTEPVTGCIAVPAGVVIETLTKL